MVSGSKRHALELVPSIVVPGLSSFAGLALVGRLGGDELLGLVSIAWVTATFGSAVIALGPSQVALRSVSKGESGLIPSFRAMYRRRALLIAPAVVAVGAVLSVAGRRDGAPIVLGGVWMVAQAATLFEIEVLKGEGRFALASAIASARAAIGWAAAVAVVAIVPSVTAAAIPHVVVSALAVLALRPRFASRPSEEAVQVGREIGGPVGRLSIASYSLGYADRYILQIIAGPVPVGVYTLGYQLGEGALELVTAPITNALLPRVISEFTDTAKGEAAAVATVKRGGVVILAATALSVPAVFVGNRLGLFAIVNPSDDLPVVTGIVAVAVGIQGITRLAYGLLLAQGRPSAANRCFWQVVALSAVIVPILTLRAGIRGTALATLVGYAVLAILMIRATRTPGPCA